MGTLGTREEHEQSDYIMYTLMFNPLDSLILGEQPIIANAQKI